MGVATSMKLGTQTRRWNGLTIGAVLCLSGVTLAADTPATTSAKPAHPVVAHPTTAKQSSTHSHSTAKSSKSVHGKKGTKQVARKRGQQAIDSSRAREIQTALIREHYLQGEPTGSWDSATQAAMQRYQAAQGWQSKTTPDSRALIKLGLGPNHDHLLNPDSAMVTNAANATTASAGSKDLAKQPSENRVSQK
jgi:hypothetical protein